MWTVLKTFRCFLSILLKPASEEGGKLSADANRRGGQPKKVFGPYPWYMANLHKVEDHLLPGRPVFHQPEYFVNRHKQQQQFISLCALKRLIYSQYTFETINIPSERFHKVEEHTAERSLGWNIFGEIIQGWWILHTKATNYDFGKTMFFALKKKHRLWWRWAISFTMAAMSA